MKLPLLLIATFLYSYSFAQLLPDKSYHSTKKKHVVEYEKKVLNDTIWLDRDSVSASNLPTRNYSFKFRVLRGRNLECGISKQLGGGGPDFNCRFPREPLDRGDSGEYVMSFPGRVMMPPFVLSRYYIPNNTAHKRDTLIINQIYRWANRDTICYEYQLGKFPYNVVCHEIDMNPDILYVNLHENEVTSLHAMQALADSIPINYFFLEHGVNRRITGSCDDHHYSMDPNRIFTEVGREKTLADDDNKFDSELRCADQLYNSISWRIHNAKSIIALHNNTDEYYSIFSYVEGGSEAENTGDLYISEEMDKDDFIYTTVPAIFEAAKSAKINVILQNKETFVDDGSLSVYCELHNIPYVNVETEHGHLQEQIKLLAWAREIMTQVLQKD